MPRWEVPTCQPLYVFVGLVQPMAKAPALPITLIWGYFPTPKSSFPLTHSRCHGQPMRLCHHWSHSGFWEGPPLRQAAQTCVHFQVGHFHTGLSNWRKGSVAPPTGPHLGKSITIINKQHSLPAWTRLGRLKAFCTSLPKSSQPSPRRHYVSKEETEALRGYLSQDWSKGCPSRPSKQ